MDGNAFSSLSCTLLHTRSSSTPMRSVLVTGGAGFIGSNLTLELQRRHPEAWIVVMDDFRSGDFKNLEGFKGDCIAANVAELDFSKRFREGTFEAIFHLASITDTTDHDQFKQVHDNVEGFRNLLQWAEKDQTPIVYASSAATYGKSESIMGEESAPSPQNVYGFSKVLLDNLCDYYRRQHPAWNLVGLRYFNVYGPREAHKGHMASMIYQLFLQMKAGKKPRIFEDGNQKRDFVYVKDVVDVTLAALVAPVSGIYNAGSGASASFNQVIEGLNKALGLSLDIEYFENPYTFYQNFTQADISKARKDLNYEPVFDLDRGINDYVRWLLRGENA